MKGFELGTFSAFDGALDVRLLGDLGRSWIFHIFSQSSVSSLCFASEGHFWEQSLARGQHPAAFRGDQRPSRGGEAARRGESFGDCEKTKYGRGPRLGDVMGF